MALIAEILNGAFNRKQNSLYTQDNPKNTFSKPNAYSADLTQTPLITPPSGKRLLIKGITLQTEGTNGIISLKRGNGIPVDAEINTDVVLTLYASTQNKAAASSNLNVPLDVDETLDLEISGIGAKNSFVGVSYRIIERSEVW